MRALRDFLAPQARAAPRRRQPERGGVEFLAAVPKVRAEQVVGGVSHSLLVRLPVNRHVFTARGGRQIVSLHFIRRC
jgi:hypothetical protein